MVTRADPFQFTTEPGTNPVPFTVRVNAAVAAVALAGDNELMEGTGFERPRTPPLPVTLAKVPSGNAPMELMTRMESELEAAVELTETATLATTPLLIVLEPGPIAAQVTNPVLDAQLRVWLAAVSDGPAATTSDVISLGG